MDILISGASTGIGRACAVHFARKRHTVYAGVRSQKSFDELKRLNVQGLEPIFLDVTDHASVSAALSTVKKKSGILHALVNNAGVAVGGPIEGLSLEDWHRQFEINFFGLVDLTREALPSIRESRGRIINMSSVAGRIASPFMAPYASSKFALEAFSDSLRREVRRFGIHVAVIEPGPIQTPIWEKSMSDAETLRASLSEDVKMIYGHTLEKFINYMQNAGRTGAPVSHVVKAVEHALTSSMPRTRYPVGRGIGTIARLSNVLPDSWMDKLLSGRVKN